MTKTDDLFEAITARIIEAIETDNHGKWNKPWTTVLAGSGVATNAVTKNAYRGMNALVGMFEVAINDYRTNLWGTYRQWQSVDAQVRKGEKGTKMVKWGITYRCSHCNHKGRSSCPVKEHTNDRNIWASGFTVFNADQVDGYDVPEPKDLGDGPEIVEAIEEFIEATGADIRHKLSDRAYYSPAEDRITLPAREQFETVQGYYGTKLHKLTHWTGGKARLDREVGNVFGDAKYAAEELVAELGATFLAASFGVEVEPHPEHAAYLASWVRTMKDTPKALYRAAKLAQEAMEYLQSLQTADEKAEVNA